MVAATRCLFPVFAAAFTGFAAQAACAVDTYPSRPLRFITAFPPGSSSDIIARILANKLTELLGQQVVVDPRAGGAGAIGTEIAKNAAPDGYNMLLAHFGTFALMPALKPKLPYDPDKDFFALTRVAASAFVVAVHPSLGVNTTADLIKLAKSQPGKISFGSSGIGSTPHLSGEMLNLLAGIHTLHVPYKGANLAVNDLIAGQIQFAIGTPLVTMPHARTGRLKGIATTGAKRDPLLPELPPVSDTVPGYQSTVWWGVAVPAKTPSEIVRKLYGVVVKALQTPEVRTQFTNQGAGTHSESPAEFLTFIRAERERMAQLGRKTKIALD